MELVLGVKIAWGTTSGFNLIWYGSPSSLIFEKVMTHPSSKMLLSLHISLNEEL